MRTRSHLVWVAVAIEKKYPAMRFLPTYVSAIDYMRHT